MPKRLEPPVTDVSRPFWDATRERRLVIQWCGACESTVHYPREICPTCLGSELEFRPSSGAGEVHAWTVMHSPAHPGMADAAPYVVALVELTEGARMMTNVVGCPPGDVRVGLPVSVTWEELSDGRHLPLFMPIEPTA